MMRLLSVLFVFNSLFGTAPVFAVDICENELMSLGLEGSKTEANYGLAMDYLNAQGLTLLTTPVNSGKVSVVFRASLNPWSAPVAMKFSRFSAHKKIVIREMNFKTEVDRQLAIWRLAEALYQAQVQEKLFSAELIASRLPRSLDLQNAGADDDFAYFLLSMPRAWREERAQFLAKLQSEMYALFASLPLLNADRLLPQRSSSGFRWLRWLRNSDTSQSIVPTQSGFAAWKASGGPAGVQSSLSEQQGRTLLFNYYFNHLKRMVRVGLMLSVMTAAIPHVPEIPTFIESVMAPQAQAVADPRVVQQVKYLKREIVRQEQKATPDQEFIQSLTLELQQLIDINPALAYIE